MGFEHWGGTWVDVNKDPLNPADTNMCWAAAAANVLAWTGWGARAGFDSAEDIFAYYQAHWTNEGGLMQHAWQWWFDGTNPARGWAGWAQVDAPGGNVAGARDPFDAFYHRTGMNSHAMSAIDQRLREGYGVAIIATRPGRSHALTVWGFDFDSDDYLGIWVTDSDDYSLIGESPTALHYIPVSYQDGRWFLEDADGSLTRYINEVQALARAPGTEFPTLSPSVPVPEPATAVLLALSLSWLFRPRRPECSRTH